MLVCDRRAGLTTRKSSTVDKYEELAYALYKESDDFIEGLVAARESRGVSISQLAEAMNVDEETLVGVENGSVNPTLQLLTDYALEVGVKFHVQVEHLGSKTGQKRLA